MIHELHVMLFRIWHEDAVTKWESLALLAIALAFLIAGAARWVEFLDFGFSKVRRAVLISTHLLGCLFLTGAFILQAIDLDKKFSNIGLGLLISSLFLLFPSHIYIALLRRVRNKAGGSTRF